MQNNLLFIQVFVISLLFGIVALLIFFGFRKIFAPKKILILKNLIKSGNYKAAVNTAKDILNKERNNIEAHFYLGEAYYNLQKFELALMEYKTAEKSGIYTGLNEKNLREKLSELYSRTENFDEALKEIILLIKSNPDDFTYYAAAGEIFLKKENSGQAIKYFAHAVKLNKNHVPSLNSIGMILFENKKYLDAQKYLQHAVNIDNTNNKAFFYLGLIESNLNNYKVALKYFEKSMKDKDMKIKSLMERGKIFIMQYKYDEAVIELDRALKNCEEEGNIKQNLRYVLAGCFEEKRNITEALQLWEEIYKINPNFKDVSEKLTSYQELRMDDRMKDFMTAMDPDFIDMSKGIVEQMGLNVIDVQLLNKDSIELLCLEHDTKWRNVKKRPKLIHISRKTAPIDESVVRDLHEKMREKGVIRGLIITSSTFTKMAVLFAKERPIELIDKNNLQNILKNANI